MPQPNPHTSPMLCNLHGGDDEPRGRALPATDVAIALRGGGCSPVLASDEAHVRGSLPHGVTISCTRVGAEWRVRGPSLDAVVTGAASLAGLPDLIRAVYTPIALNPGAAFAGMAS